VTSSLIVGLLLINKTPQYQPFCEMTHIEHMPGISAGAARDIANNSLTGHFIRSRGTGPSFRVEQAREQSARIGKLPGACGRDRDPIAAGLEPVGS